MNEDQIKATVVVAGCALIVAAGVRDMIHTRNVERSKRKALLDEMGLDVAAIHNATDVVNARIDRGEIRSYDELRDAVMVEVAFQKISIRENL